MRVLVAISILAFLALLWASVAVFRHIRRVRRRRRRALETFRISSSPPPERFVIAPAAAAPQAAPEISFTDPEAPLPEVPFKVSETGIREPTPLAIQPNIRPVDPTPEPVSSLDAALPLEPRPPQSAPAAPRDPVLSPLAPWPHFGFTPARTSSSSEPIPYATPPLTESSAAVMPARIPIEIQPPAPSVKPLYPSVTPPPVEPALPNRPWPLRPDQHTVRRVDWSYYSSETGGDLSDPTPASNRQRLRSHKSD